MDLYFYWNWNYSLFQKIIALGYFSGPTMKLRRPVVLQMYQGEIESFYRE